MVVFVLEGAGRVSADLERPERSVAIMTRDRYLQVALHRPTKIRHGQAALVVLERLLGEKGDHGIDQDRERNRRFVGIPRVARPDLHREQPVRDSDLIGGNSGAIGRAHRVDQVVDPTLNLGCPNRVQLHFARPRGQRGMPDFENFTYCHLWLSCDIASGNGLRS